MNIVEAYIKYKPGLVILVSGISGSGVTNLAKQISRDFKLKLVNYKDYLVVDYHKTETVRFNDKDIEVVNWDLDEAIDWDKFIPAIERDRKSGVVAVSPSFPSKLIPNPDFHVNVKLSKQNLLHRRLEYIGEIDENRPDNKKEGLTDEQKKEDNDYQVLLFNKFTYPYYLYTTGEAKITKFINANEYANMKPDEYDAKIYDDTFDYLIGHIASWLNDRDRSVKQTQ
jgi:hypothetical protein